MRKLNGYLVTIDDKCWLYSVYRNDTSTEIKKIVDLFFGFDKVAAYKDPTMIRIIAICGTLSMFSPLFGQDSTQVLQEVTVQSFLYNRPLRSVPASISVAVKEELNRHGDISILPVVNTMTGVRMEERSPGSYRLSIRGSLIRSPFGIRNVKMYWNRLPFTDGGGNTYLNLLDFSSIGQIEVMKGPAGSLYGAGTGGVVLLSGQQPSATSLFASSVLGSYGLRKVQIGGNLKSEKVVAAVNYAQQQSDGFREHTRMNRKTLNSDVSWQLNSKNIIGASVFYSDLTYQTPGALTEAQYEEDATQARPTVGMSRGAVDQKARVINETVFGGLTHDLLWNENLSTYTGFFYSHSDFVNYAIRNLEIRDETNYGLRSETRLNFGFDHWSGTLSGGVEHQRFRSPIEVYGNDFGVKGSLMFKDDLSTILTLLFLQSEFVFSESWFITVGGSLNWLNFEFERKDPTQETHERRFSPIFSPRIALLKKLNKSISLFGSISQGFSPPSLAEVRPSTNTYNKNLSAEKGLNTELGIRSQVSKSLSFDVTAYSFRLKETIVIQRTADDADYFVNAGETVQRGLECLVSWTPLASKRAFVSDLKLWSTQTINHYRFEKYINDDQNYTGNSITGVPPTVIVAGIDLAFKPGFYANITLTYNDHIPLNDANTDYAAEYTLLGARVGYKGKAVKRVPFEFFLGIDNALDETYSLGNDLNAVGGRFYNVAPGRN